VLPAVPVFSPGVSAFVPGGHTPLQPTGDALWHKEIDRLALLFDEPPPAMDSSAGSSKEIFMQAPFSAQDDDLPLTQMSAEELQDLLGRHVVEDAGVASDLVPQRVRSRSPRRLGLTVHAEADAAVTASTGEASSCVSLNAIPKCCIAAFVNGGADELMKGFIGLEAARAMRRLPLHFQQHIMQMLMVSPFMWDNPGAHVLEVVQTYLLLQSTSPARLIGNIARLVVVSGCTGTGCPLIACHWALINVKMCNPTVTFHVEKCLSYELNPFACEMARLTQQETNWQMDVSGDIASFSGDVGNKLSLYSQCFFLLVAGTECTDTTFANKNRIAPGASRLHGPHSRTWFHWHAGVKEIVRMVGCKRVVHMSEYPQCQDKADEDTINKMAGKPVVTDAADWGCATRKRYWRVSPRLPPEASQVKPQQIHRCNVQVDLDGFRWAPGPAASAALPHPVVLRRHWPILIEKAARGELMSSYERMTLDSLKVIQGSVRKYAGVGFFLTHLGFAISPSLSAIRTLRPCLGHVVVGTGDMVPADHPQASPCGLQIFCTNCFDTLRVLGGAWHLHSAVEVLTRVLLTACGEWINGEGNVPWHDWAEEAHICNRDCPLAP
jgi:hypothetical protein